MEWERAFPALPDLPVTKQRRAIDIHLLVASETGSPGNGQLQTLAYSSIPPCQLQYLTMKKSLVAGNSSFPFDKTLQFSSFMV
jgi:hypothetical protein